MKDILEILQKFMPLELALITAVFIYLLFFFKRVADKIVDISDKQAQLAREQAGYIKERLDVVEKTLGINDRAIDLRKKQIEELTAIAEQRDRQYQEAQQKNVKVETELREVSSALQDAQTKYIAAVEHLRIQEKDKRDLRQAGESLESSVQVGLARVFVHELSMPIQGILANTEHLLDEIEQDPTFHPLREKTSRILALVTFTGQLLGNTEFLARHSETRTIETEQIDLIVTFRRVLSTYRQLYKEKCIIIEITPDISSKIILVNANQNALEIVLGNVLHNAVKYSYRNTAVKIEIKESEMHVDIFITNLGLGIAPDEMQRVFEFGYRGPLTADRFRTGMGLGLSVARKLLDTMNGLIEISSQPQGDANRHLVTAHLRVRKI